MSKFKPLLAAIGIAMASPFASAELIVNRTVVNNDRADERLEVSVKIPNGVTGDLYIAAQANNQLFFLINNGNGPQFRPSVEPYDIDVSSGTLSVLNLSSSFIPTGRIPLYQILVHSGADPLDFNNWIGGLNGLSTIQIVAGLPTEINQDFNNDGFPDDDANHDGFHDDDKNKDGFHDDDLNHNGYLEANEGAGEGGIDDGHTGEGGIDDGHTGNTGNGQTLYTAKCASYHGADPAQNINKILNGKDPARIRAAINKQYRGYGVFKRSKR